MQPLTGIFFQISPTYRNEPNTPGLHPQCLLGLLYD